MSSMLWWLAKAATYVANTRLGKAALASQLDFINQYLQKGIHPDQIDSSDEVRLSDLAFNATVRFSHFWL